MAEGFEWTSNGTAPQPMLRIGNTTRVMSAIVADLKDLVGAEVTRTKTFRKYLDGEPSANPAIFFDPDIFIVDGMDHECIDDEDFKKINEEVLKFFKIN